MTGRPKKKSNQKEKSLQKQVEAILDLHQIRYIHLTTNITRKIGNRFINFSVEKNKGFPDLEIYVPNGKSILIELKRAKGGRMSKEQKEWQGYLQKNGYNHHVVKSFEEFKVIMKPYLRRVCEV